MAEVLKEFVVKEMTSRKWSDRMDVPIAKMVVRPEAQRELDVKRAARYADGWDPKLVGVLVLAANDDGTYELIDGQHRQYAASIAGVEELFSEVHYGLSNRERSELFIRLQEERKGLDKVTEFNVGIDAGRPRNLDVQTVLAKHGLKVGKTSSTNVIASVSGLLKTYDLGGSTALDTTVSAMKEAFSGHGNKSWQGDILAGTGIVVANNPTVDRKRLVRTLQKYVPSQWAGFIAEASKGSGGSGGRPRHMARLLVDHYNRGLRDVSKKLSL